MFRKRVTPPLEEVDGYEGEHGWTPQEVVKGNNNAWVGGANEHEHGHEDDEEGEDLLPSRRTRTAVKDEGYSTGSEDLGDSGEEGDDRQQLPAAGSTERELRTWTRSEVAEASLLLPLPRTDGQAEATDEDEETIPIEPFNMDAELAEGHIDEVTGDYVRTRRDGETRRDPGDMDEQDLGLTGLSREARAKTRRAAAERRRREEEAQAAVAAPSLTSSRGALVGTLLSQLALGETPAEALARRRPPPRRPPPRGARKPTDSLPNDRDHRARMAAMDAELQRKQEVGIITDACTELLTMGLLDVYEMTREELARIK